MIRCSAEYNDYCINIYRANIFCANVSNWSIANNDGVINNITIYAATVNKLNTPKFHSIRDWDKDKKTSGGRRHIDEYYDEVD